MFYYQEAQRQAVAKGEYGKVKQINQIIERILMQSRNYVAMSVFKLLRNSSFCRAIF